MDFAGLRVRKPALPIKHHMKKIPIKQKRKKFFFFPTTAAPFFHHLRKGTVNSQNVFQHLMLQLLIHVNSSEFIVIED